MSSCTANTSGRRPDPVPAWFDNSGPESDVVISTRIRLARNLANHHFPSRASTLERKNIFKEVADVFARSSQFRALEVINFSRLKKLEQEFLVEERVVSPDLMGLDGERGVVCDRSRRVNIMINEEDHIRVQGMDSGFKPHEIWSVVDMLDDSLGQKLTYAYDSQRGFLTCCPTNSGTGLRVSFLMHLPGLVLTKSIDAVLQGASQMGISTRGFFGEHSEVVGNFFQLSNHATMGSHEQEFIDNTKRIILEVASFERKARERILREAKLEVSDKIHRSYGILMHARTISMRELLNLLSAMRLGIECDVFKPVTIEHLNRITLVAMPAHLQLTHERAMDETEIGVARAELVRELLTKKKRKNSSTKMVD